MLSTEQRRTIVQNGLFTLLKKKKYWKIPILISRHIIRASITNASLPEYFQAPIWQAIAQ